MKKKNKNTNEKILGGIITAIILITLIIFGANNKVLNAASNILGANIYFEDTNNIANTNTSKVRTEVNLTDNLKVYYIDVGQADSILIMNKDKSMLIDAGNNEDGNFVVDFIKEKGISKLNYVIGTHPHEDHIGGLDTVIKNIEVENILMPKISTNTKTYEEVIDAISEKKLKIVSPKKGYTFNIGDAGCETMTDPILDETNLNLSSIVIRLEFGNNSFLFMGDAESENEKLVTWPKTDVLKVGHHGSRTSTSDYFIKQVMPKYSIIMVGKDNDYGLPKDKIIRRLEYVKTKIYRTDKNGTIELTSDGNNIDIICEK